jgi:hypothetical protein
MTPSKQSQDGTGFVAVGIPANTSRVKALLFYDGICREEGFDLPFAKG